MDAVTRQAWQVKVFQKYLDRVPGGGSQHGSFKGYVTSSEHEWIGFTLQAKIYQM